MAEAGFGATHASVSYPQRMHSLVQLGHAAVVAAVLLTSSTPEGRTNRGHHLSREDRDLERVLDLMAPLAQTVLGSSDRDALEANIEEQLFSGLFSDLIAKSVQAVAHAPVLEESDEVRQQFLTAVGELGGDLGKTKTALRLAQISVRLSFALVHANLDDIGDDILAPSDFDLTDFLYDIEVPAEIREAAQADFESAICMLALAYAAAARAEAPAWLIGELVERWLAGKRKSLPALVAIAVEQQVILDDVLSSDLLGALDEILERVPDLAAAQRHTDKVVEELSVIAEHASRQPDGVWPKT